MTKRLLFYPLATLVVGAALLFAALFSANIHAQVYDFDSANVESLSEINPMLSAGAVLAPGLLVGHSDGLGSWTPIAPVGVSPQALYILDAATITIGDMDIEFLADGTLKFDDSRAEEFTTGLAAAVATNDNTGSFDLNDIVFVGVRDTGNGEAYGFAYVAAAPFTGGVIEGKTITVIGMNNATLGTTQVRGVSFDDGAAGKQHLVGTDITFGNITVASEGAQAWGFYVYGDVDTDSKVNLGDIFAQGAANARGIYVDQLEGETTVGKITAISSNNFARGVQASGIENLTVNGDIIAIGDSAHGILTDKWGTSSDTLPTTGNGNVADLFVAGTITAKATGSGGARGIQVGGDVTGNIDVVGGIQATSTTGSAVGIQVNGAITNANIDVKGNLSVGGVNGHSIVATATSGSAYGIYGGGLVTGSTIDIGNISATSTTGAAYGVAFGDEIGAGSNLEFGKIAATVSGTTSEGAIGFVSGAVTEDATITFKGDVDAIATDGEYAVGVQFGDVVGGLETVAGTVEIGNITAKSKGVAQGLLFGGTTGIGSVKVGKITVVSTGTGPLHGAFGIQAEDYANLILNGDINVTGARTDDFAAGVRLDNGGTLTLAKSVKINAALGVAEGYGIWSQGNLNIDLGTFTLTNNSTEVVGNLTVKGAGTADLGVVIVNGNTIFGDGTNELTVVLDKDASTLGNGNVVNTNATLALGDGTHGEVRDNLGIFTTLDGKAIGTFTDWFINGDGFLQAARTSSVNMNDGYLATFNMHNRHAVWNAVRDRMISGSGRNNVRQYRGQAPCDPCEAVACDPCAPCVNYSNSDFSPNVAWVNYIGRSDTYRSSYNNRDWRLSAEGVQVGTDLVRSRRSQFGLLFGYESGRNTNASDRIKSDDTYIGVYTACVLDSGADIRGVFGYGWQKYDMNRWSGSNLYTSSFKGNTMEGNLEIGKRTAMGPWSLRPVLAVDVTSNKIKGTSETGGSQAVKYDNTHLSQVFVRAGSELRYLVRGFTVNSGVYYAYDVHGRDRLHTGVSTLDGRYSSQLPGTSLGRSLLLFNLGGSCQITQNFAVIGGYEGQVVTDRNKDFQSAGYIGGSWKW